MSQLFTLGTLVNCEDPDEMQQNAAFYHNQNNPNSFVLTIYFASDI